MKNIKEIAEIAKVGVGTVSRVVNNSGYVSKATREKIERVIAEHGFYSNEIARSMNRQRNNIIAFLIPNSTHHFFGKLIHDVEKVLSEKGYYLMLCQSSEQISKDIAYLHLLKIKRVDGIILLTNNPLEEYITKDMPIITFDRKFTDIPFVASDNFQGGIIAARELISKGCRNFAFIGDDAQGMHSKVDTEVSKRRLGFITELNNEGIQSILNIEYPLGDYNYIPESVFETIIDHKEIDAIFCNNDNIAAELIKRLENNQRYVPKDVKVVGFDGGVEGFNIGRTITSIRQDTQKIAGALVSNLLLKIEGNEVDNTIVPVELYQGETI